MGKNFMQLSKLLLISAIHCSVASAQQYSKYIQAVDEYRPAPGQNINETPEYEPGDSEADMIRKCSERLSDNRCELVALGAYGGYLTFHFDHPVANIAGERDFAIWGNAIQSELSLFPGGGSGEAGIVMVSQDVNHNHLPDDPWYEISGSCDVDSAALMDYHYEITYYKNPMGKIPWTDNRGARDSLDRWEMYHPQEYYPEWLPDSLSFRGTRLPNNGFDVSHMVAQSYSQYWIKYFFAWGYADNQPNYLADHTTPNLEGCGIDISWAVDDERRPVSLAHVDFIRVYTGINQKCGWQLETSTEILGAEDLHLDASIAAMTAIQSADISGEQPSVLFDLLGRRVGQSAKPGLYIRNKKKILIK